MASWQGRHRTGKGCVIVAPEYLYQACCYLGRCSPDFSNDSENRGLANVAYCRTGQRSVDGRLSVGGAQLADMHLPVADNPNGSRGRVVAD